MVAANTLGGTQIKNPGGSDVGGRERLLWPPAFSVFSIGVLVDTTQNYSSAFYSCAAGMVLGAVFLSLVRPCKAGLCRRQQQHHTEESAAVVAPDLPDDFIEMDITKAENSGKGCDSAA